MNNIITTIRLHPRHPLPPFNLPAAAFQALDAATRESRIVSFTVSPCGAEESTVVTLGFEFSY